MYVDRPRPAPRTLLLPLALALFFAAMGSVIVFLALVSLPPVLFGFTMPVIALCAAGAVATGWHLSTLIRLEYRVGDGLLEIRRGGTRLIYRLEDVTAIVPAAPPAVTDATGRTDRSGVASARQFGNRPGANVLVQVRGEWIRLSPTHPSAFLRAMEGERPPAGPAGSASRPNA